MLSLSQTAGYAILALSCLDGERWVLAQELAERTAVPKPYLSKILHSLARAQVILAKRGYRGGFRLGRPADQISLLDIVEAVDGTAWIGRCLLGLDRCSDERACPTHEFWKHERARIHDLLQKISLHHVAEFERERGTRLRPATSSGSARDADPRAWSSEHDRRDRGADGGDDSAP